MELIVQPTDGIKPLLETIGQAQKSVDVMILRFDLKAMEKELVAARERVYAAVAQIGLDGSHHRSDIALKAEQGLITV